MHDDVLERFVARLHRERHGRRGRVLLAGRRTDADGARVLRKVVALQKKHAKPGQRIENDLQTNGTLLDEDWARFLKEHSFLVGLSHRRSARTYTTTTGSPSAASRPSTGSATRRRRCATTRRALQHAHLRESLQRIAAARRLSLPQPRARLDLPAVHPDRRATGFEGTAPQRWDLERMVALGDPAAEPRSPGVGRHAVDGGRRRIRLFPVEGLGRVAGARLRQGAGEFLRDAGRAAHGPAVAGLRARRVLRQGRGAGARRQRLCLRPLRLSGIPARKRARAFTRRHGVLAGQVRFGYAKSRACPRTAGSASSSPTAGASVRRTGSCGRRTASRA